MIENPYILVVDGQAGSAKSPTIKLVENQLTDKGIPTISFNPIAESRRRLKEASGRTMSPLEEYLLVYNEFTAPESRRVYRIEEYIRNVIRELTEAAIAGGYHCVIFDRHWPTILASIEDAVALDDKERTELSSSWVTPMPPPTLFFDTTIAVVEQRRGFSRNIPWMNDQETHEREHERRRKIYITYQSAHLMEPIFISHSREDLTPIANKIVQKIYEDICRKS